MASEIRQQLVEMLPRLRRFALALSGSPTDAEDLVQSAVERALRAQHQWKEGTRLDSWMFRIIQNLWFDQLRANRKCSHGLDDAAFNIAGEDGREVVAARANLRAVSAAFNELNRDQQVVLAMVAIDGTAYKEAADALGIAVGTVMSRVARARSAMAARLTGAPL